MSESKFPTVPPIQYGQGQVPIVGMKDFIDRANAWLASQEFKDAASEKTHELYLKAYKRAFEFNQD